MKRIVLAMFFLTFIFLSCEKYEGNGSLLVQVQYNGKPIEQATIYLKKGNDTTTTFPPKVFDKKVSADAIGQEHFEYLLPDTYTLYGVGYSPQKGGQVVGKASVVVLNRSRLNSYEIIINAK